jgi:hypothetical protein
VWFASFRFHSRSTQTTNTMNAPYHVIYVPEDAPSKGQTARYSLLRTNDPNDILLNLATAPDALSLHLEAESEEEAQEELIALGFSQSPY